MAIFDLENGAAQTCPKLKASYTFNGKTVDFDAEFAKFGAVFTQPTVSDTNGDDAVEVSW